MDYLVSGSPKRHLLTIGLTDYFQAGALKTLIHRRHWPRFETRIEQNTLKTLDLLGRYDTRATFFVMGWVAERQHELIQEVRRRGHEIANLGYYQRSVREMTRSEFEDDLKRSRDAVEDASGRRVLGYRAARRLFSPSDLWALDVLARSGYIYDSSIFPIFQSFKTEPWRRFQHLHRNGKDAIWEFPFSMWDCFGCLLPIAGGNYFRQFPHSLMKKKVADWDRRYDAPFVMYFHVWDLDSEQPKISAAPRLVRMRAYRNLAKMPWIIEDYLRNYRFGTIANHLGIESEEGAASLCQAPDQLSVGSLNGHPRHGEAALPATAAQSVPYPKLGLTIVIPCFNEAPVLPYLRNTVESVRQSLSSKYKIRLILIDDGSTDRTWELLNDLFGSETGTKLLRQPKNLGVAATIMNGIRSAQTELVCSIDCDCTYDAHELERLVPHLTEGVDLVTGSPYHPLGKVFNVPGWRLVLSKSASYLYRCVLRQRLHTYTSCFRVYRRSAVVNLDLKEGGFLGVPELLGKLDLQGSRIVECPTTLEVRILGESKMKIARTIMGHVYLLTLLFGAHVKQRFSRRKPKTVSAYEQLTDSLNHE